VILNEHPSVQIVVFLNQVILTMIYIILVRPFEEPLLNLLEIFNECSILVNAYHLVAFTDYLPNIEQNDTLKAQVGLSMIAFTGLNVGVNTLVMMYMTVRMVKFGLIRMKLRAEAWVERKRAEIRKQKEMEVSEFVALVYRNLDRHKKAVQKQPPPPPVFVDSLMSSSSEES
jgi:hypothetical protein